MNIRRLNKLADFLDKLSAPKFNFENVISAYDGFKECGTVCCAVGWMPVVFPRLVKWDKTNIGIFTVCLKKDEDIYYFDEVAAEIFDITRDEALELFSPGQSRPWIRMSSLGPKATPKQVANSIRRFISWKRKQARVKV